MLSIILTVLFLVAAAFQQHLCEKELARLRSIIEGQDEVIRKQRHLIEERMTEVVEKELAPKRGRQRKSVS